jgi:putative aminopeptidase FrvX
MNSLKTLRDTMYELHPLVERHVTRDRLRRYLIALMDAPAPSTAATAMRLPILRRLLDEDHAFQDGRLRLDADFRGAGSPAILTGDLKSEKPLWYFAHLDTISYLVQPADGDRTPLVPFCVHLMQDGACAANAYRFDVDSNGYVAVAEGQLESVSGAPFFRSKTPGSMLRPGDRVAPVCSFRETGQGGVFTGLMDNAGGVASLALAAPVLARAGVEALLAFPDEEEGPLGAGNQTIGRGASRMVGMLPTPNLAIVADVQQSGGEPGADVRGSVGNSTRLGGGAVLAEFSSLARGAVTPPDLYALAQRAGELLAELGVRLQESNNAYSSRSDDVGVMLKTPNILLLGFPGFNRHFDRGEPRAHLDDLLQLAKALVYLSAVAPCLARHRRALLGAAS